MRMVAVPGRVIAFLTCVSVMTVACSSAPLTQPSWGLPEDAMALADDAGLQPTAKEELRTHFHSHLSIYVDGALIEVPSGIGIDTQSDSGVFSEPTPDGVGTEWFVETCDAPCISPLHTHMPDGLIHTESPDPDHEPFTLGQFFTQWGIALDDRCVGEFCEPATTIDVYVDGQQIEGNPVDILLESHVLIAIVIGKPPNHIRDTWQFGEDP